MLAIGKASLRTSEENVEMPWRLIVRKKSVDRPFEVCALIHEGNETVESYSSGYLADQSVQLHMQTNANSPGVVMLRAYS